MTRRAKEKWNQLWQRVGDALTEVGMVLWLILWLAFGAWLTTLYPEEKLVINAPDWLMMITPGWMLPYLPFLAAAIIYYVQQRKKGSHAGKQKHLKRMVGNAIALGMGPVATLSHIVEIM